MRASTQSAGSTYNASFGAKQKVWLPSNFRLTLPGLDCTGVSKIEAIDVTIGIASRTAGAMQETAHVATGLTIPNVKVTVEEVRAASWSDWIEQFVVQGDSGPQKLKAGSIEYLQAGLGQPLWRLDLGGVGICALRDLKAESGDEQIRRLQAEMYCDTIKYSVPGLGPDGTDANVPATTGGATVRRILKPVKPKQ